MDIFLIRHTAVYNPGKLCYGHAEIPLEENFTHNFNSLEEKLGNALKTDAFFYSSPLRRCIKLASFLSKDNFVMDDKIKELNFGNWELQAWNSINSKQLDAWMADFVNYKIPNGESFIELAHRCGLFWELIKQNCSHQNLFVITHAGVIRSVLANILQFPLHKSFDIQIDYASITKINYDKELDKTSIAYINLS
ncbi:MAG: alpha-ribazole phosphatase [Sphingobacteriales bacterium]|nr:MAG: alpha-ribazole phosphatase [Sphingobacteriales bacterium]